MPFDPTPVWNTKPRWSSCRNGNLNQQPEPEFLDEIGSTKPDRSIGYTITDSKKVLNTTQIHEVERIQFSDKTLALDFSVGQNGYKAAMFVGAAFGAKSLSTYFSPAVGLIDSGTSVAQLSQLVIDLGLIDSLVGSSNKAFVNHVYKNVVGVAPDPFSEALYVNYLNQGVFTKASLLELASTVPLLETQVDLVGLQTNGIEYLPFL